MTNRPQILRSSVTGQQPTAGTRQPGELWTTFPDKQLGIIDASKNAQPMIAVRFFSTGANYAVGDYVVQAGQLYRARVAVTAGAFNSSQWTLTGGSVLVSAAAPSNPTPGDMWFDSAGGQLYVYYNDGDTSQWVVAVNQNIAGGVYLPLGGGTMSGDIVNATVSADPTTAKGVASKRYVDAGDSALSASIATLSPLLLGDNRIINGDMRIDQRNGGASGAALGYTVDRWAYGSNLAGKGTWQRATLGAGGLANGLGYALQFTSSSAYASAAADAFYLAQYVEADTISDLAWGTAGAQPVTLSFWAQSTLTGTFSGSLQNYAGARSYPFSFSLPTANVWTKIVVAIPGDTSGTWVLQSNVGALGVVFDLGSGTGKRGPAGAWAGANYLGATGAVSVVGTNAAAFYMTGVKLEIGSVATPFNRQSLAKSLADCQRYYQVGSAAQNVGGNSWVGGWTNGHVLPLPVLMRATPTTTTNPVTQTNCTATAVTGLTPAALNHGYQISGATGGVSSTANWTASAEL